MAAMDLYGTPDYGDSEMENVTEPKHGRCSFAGSNDQIRVVAKQRRHLENEELEKLSAELPIAKAISGQHIDKATVVRLASTYIRLNNCLSGISNAPNSGNTYAQHNVPYQLGNRSLLETLNGFLACFTVSGEILYISETISIHLGLSQIDLTGNRIERYIHPDDSHRFSQVLSTIYHDGKPMIVNLRIKSTLTKRATKDASRCTIGFKVVSMNVNIFYGNNQSTGERCFAAFGQILPTVLPALIHLDYQSFAVFTDANLTIRSTDSRCKEILTSPFCFQADVILEGKSFYNIVYVEDVYIVRTMHLEAVKFGASVTPYYRLIKNDCTSTIYVQTRAAYSPTTSRPLARTLVLVTRVLL